MKKILLIITGSIAAYKSLDLLRCLKAAGHTVVPVMTRNAEVFVTPLSVAALAGHPVYRDLFSLTDEASMGHIRLARECDVVVVAPATANFIAKHKNGLCDDLASTLLLVTDKPIIMAPAMNVSMWHHPTTQANIRCLQAQGITFIPPASGSLACGEEGEGRMADVEDILKSIMGDQPLKGCRVLVTAGPTREPLDPIRYLSNHSSGKQGFAIATAFAQKGADVTVVHGPCTTPLPQHVQAIAVTTAQEMLDTCLALPSFDVVVATAAVCDWKPTTYTEHKLKKTDAPTLNISLEKNPDILQRLAAPSPHRAKLVIGFAAETHDGLQHAKDKRVAKGCDVIILNIITKDTPVFGASTNHVTWIDDHHQEAWPQMSKQAVAERIVTNVITLLQKD